MVFENYSVFTNNMKKISTNEKNILCVILLRKGKTPALTMPGFNHYRLPVWLTGKNLERGCTMNSAAQKRAKKKAAEKRRKAMWKSVCIFHRAGRELAFFGIVAAFGMKLPEIVLNAWAHLTAFAVSTCTQILTVFGLA
jgi:hypothetical protein